MRFIAIIAVVAIIAVTVVIVHIINKRRVEQWQKLDDLDNRLRQANHKLDIATTSLRTISTGSVNPENEASIALMDIYDYNQKEIS